MAGRCRRTSRWAMSLTCGHIAREIALALGCPGCCVTGRVVAQDAHAGSPWQDALRPWAPPPRQTIVERGATAACRCGGRHRGAKEDAPNATRIMGIHEISRRTCRTGSASAHCRTGSVAICLAGGWSVTDTSVGLVMCSNTARAPTFRSHFGSRHPILREPLGKAGRG